MGNTNPLMGGKDYPSSGNIDDPLNWRPKEQRPQVAVAAELIEDPSNLNYRQVPEVGYRVLNVQSNSPASYTGLVSFFDFIVAANKIPLKALDTTFINIIKASEEKPMTLIVYNTKKHTYREVILVPSKAWPGEGMLGVTIRFDSFEDADEQVLHVLDVEPNSPAEIAGLQPYTDYLLGTMEKVFKNSNLLGEELRSNANHPIEVFVYNSETDEVRTVVILPTNDWGGNGLLGADIGEGFLHRIPVDNTNSLGKSVEVANNHAINSPFGVNPQPEVKSLPIAQPMAPRTTVDLEGNAYSAQPPTPPAAPVTTGLPSQI